MSGKKSHPWLKRPEQLGLVETGGEIGDADFYPTPNWCTEGLLQACPPPREVLAVHRDPGGSGGVKMQSTIILECAAGSGAVVRPLREAGYDVRALELRPRALPLLRELCPSEWGCWLRFSEPERGYQELVRLCGCSLDRVAIITNPPYAIALDFTAQALLTPSPWVCMLLRVNVIASRPWREIFATPRTGQEVRRPGTLTPPTTIVNLVRRPSFTGDGNTSMDNYAWFVWASGQVPIDFRPIG